ncbi:TPA: replication-associated recombination protein A [Candidatus Galligastranaerophilus faecipullorum]|nr:replication-associated recombination protein A [Candidatus Galligastranaerophilus faecipullorum]
MNLFDALEDNNKQMPLAQILRPKSLDEYLGQTNVISENSPVYNLLKAKRLFSFILWGPPGCGKTTLARLIANYHNANFIELSAVTSGVKDVKDAVLSAKENLRSGVRTIVFIDEIHRYSKTQQDALLPHIENGTFHLMGSTTENPSFQVIPALLSRAQVIILNPVDDESIKKIINKGYDYLFKNYPAQNVKVKDEALETIVKLARGDARFALNTVENSYFAANGEVTKELIENLLQKRTAKYGIDEHYDLASAYQKSLRGSDADAAIYYLAKMLVSGEDPRFIARRLLVVASEDVGNADFRALLVAEAALRAIEHLGMPEGRIALAQATEFVARAKKSNRAICAVDAAISDIKNGLDFKPPLHLRDAHYKDASKYGFGEGYIYTHNAPDVYQRFMPDELGDKKYFT